MMKKQTKRRIISSGIAVVFTLTTTAFADGWRVGNVTNGDENAPFMVGNYTFMSPSLSGTKMILQDPKLAEKSWVEYVEYNPKPIAEIQEDDIKYYIYQPNDYAVSSIMALKDYNPDAITGSSTNLSVSIGELGSIFEAAALGNGISAKLFGGSLSTDTIAAEMTSTADIVKNSKYYATPSFMGIPDDDEYNGVSNSGYYNASSMTISMTKSSSVQVTKTNTSNSSMSIGSNESSSTSLSSSKQYSNTRTVSNTTSDTSSKSVSIGKTHTDSSSGTHTDSSSGTHTDSSSDTHTDSSSDTHTDNVSSTHEKASSTTLGYSSSQNAAAVIESIGSLANFIPGVGSIIGGALKSIAGPVGKALGETTKKTDHQTSEKDSSTSGSSDSSTSGSSDSSTTGSSNSTTTGSSNSTTSGSSDSSSTTDSSTVSNAVSKAISEANSSSDSSSSGSSATIGTNASTSIGYGLNYAQSQQTSISETVSRTFSARDDDSVKNVGWKLCKYVVRVPYYIEAVKVSGADETLVYSQYVTYDLLTGVSRVFANGYIEHWNTGELVPYADFFEGFVTAQELVDTAKMQAKDKE